MNLPILRYYTTILLLRYLRKIKTAFFLMTDPYFLALGCQKKFYFKKTKIVSTNCHEKIRAETHPFVIGKAGAGHGQKGSVK